MTNKEKIEHVERVAMRLLENRYRYYVLDEPILSDFEYDWLERHYASLAKEAGVPNIFENIGIGYGDSALEMIAANNVKSGTDYYSLWLNEMRPVWERLGYPKYLRKSLK